MQNDPQLIRHFQEQVYFLHQANLGFDRGVDAEAKAMAVKLRVLFHSTRTSIALVDQLDLHDTLTLYDTVTPLGADGNPVGHSALTTLLMERKRFVPRLDLEYGNSYGFVPRDAWWHRPIIIDGSGYTLTRESLVLAMADQDGGAHVDPEVNEVYQRLRDEGLGMRVGTGGNEPLALTPVFAAMRQCSYEALVSLAHQSFYEFPTEVPRRRYRYIPGPRPEDIYGNGLYISGMRLSMVDEDGNPAIHEQNAAWPDKIGRNDECPCGSGKKFKKCHGC